MDNQYKNVRPIGSNIFFVRAQYDETQMPGYNYCVAYHPDIWDYVPKDQKPILRRAIGHGKAGWVGNASWDYNSNQQSETWAVIELIPSNE